MTAPLADSESTSSITDSFLNNNNKKKPKIPDGGWGWVVVFSSFVISLIIDGISFSFGLLYIEFYHEFGASSSETAWIGSVFLSVPLLTGPIMGALVDKYGCRKMTIVGGLISCIGFLISSRVKALPLMYFTFGILSGLGLGLNYITAVVAIPFWFDKKRNLAVGLGACGLGVGTFIYAPFTTWLLYEYGWRGAVVLLAGTLLNLCICGALMRDPDWIDEENKSEKSSTLSLKSAPEDLAEIKKMLKDGKDKEYVLQTLAMNVEEKNLKDNNKEHHQSVLNLPTFIRQNEKVPIEVLEQLRENKQLYKVILENYPSLLSTRSISDKGLNKLAEEASLVTRVPVTVSLKLKKIPEIDDEKTLNNKPTQSKQQPHQGKPEKKTAIIHQHYFKNLRFPRHSLIHRGGFINKNKYRLKASSCPNIYKVSMMSIEDDDGTCWDYIEKVGFDFTPILDLHYFLMSISTLILYAWFMTPYFYLADHMESVGYSKTEASFIISTIGATNTIGMVFLGWAGDQPWCNITKVYAVCLILCGICCSGIILFMGHYILLSIVSGLYGFFLASNFSFMPTLIMDLVPLKRFTSAYGLMLLFCGIGHLGGPPLAGFLKDLTLTWDLSFHVSAFWIIISGIMIIIIPLTKNSRIIGKAPSENELGNS